MYSCTQMNEMMSLYIDDEMSQEMRIDFEKHLKSCVVCKKELAELIDIIKCCNSACDEELPPNFKDELHKKLVASVEKDKQISTIPLWHKYIKICSSIAAGVLLMVVLKGYWGNIQFSDSQKAAKSSASVNKQTALMENDTNGRSEVMSAMDSDSAPEKKGGAASAKEQLGIGNLDVVKADSDENAYDTIEKESPKNVVVNVSENPDSTIQNSFKIEAGTTFADQQPTASLSKSNIKSANAPETSNSHESSRGGEGIRQEDQAAATQQDNKAVQTATSNSFTVTAVSEMARRSTFVGLKFINPVVAMDTIKQIAAVNEAKFFESNQASGAFTAADRRITGSDSRTISIKVPNDKYERFINSLNESFGASSLSISPIDVQNVAEEIKELIKKLNEINVKIAKIEVKASSSSVDELKNLKSDRESTLAQLDKLRLDSQFTNIFIQINQN